MQKKEQAMPAVAAVNKADKSKVTDDLYDAQEGLCFHCLRLMDPWVWTPRHKNGFTREHIIPESEGGVLWRNTVLAHQWCNIRRGTASLSKIDQLRANMIIAAVVARRGGW